MKKIFDILFKLIFIVIVGLILFMFSIFWLSGLSRMEGLDYILTIAILVIICLAYIYLIYSLFKNKKS